MFMYTYTCTRISSMHTWKGKYTCTWTCKIVCVHVHRKIFAVKAQILYTCDMCLVCVTSLPICSGVQPTSASVPTLYTTSDQTLPRHMFSLWFSCTGSVCIDQTTNTCSHQLLIISSKFELPQKCGYDHVRIILRSLYVHAYRYIGIKPPS